MSQRLLGGAFIMAISLAMVGAAVTAGAIPSPTDRGPVQFQTVTTVAPDLGDQVPIRSANLDDQAVPGPDTSSNPPTLIRIGDINLEAPVRSVGVDENNEFDVPEAETVGWYQYGSAPGDAGSTVLAAHVDFGGRRGAFFNLAEVEVGDLLDVELADGTPMRYRVTDNVLYDKIDLPAEELFRRTGPPVLQLITCGGTFDHERSSYRGNVVVTAVPLEA